MEIKYIFTKSTYNRWFQDEIHSLLSRADSLMPEGAQEFYM